MLQTNELKKKISKTQLSLIISTGVMVIILLTIFIINCFIPLQYFGTYLVRKQKLQEGTMQVQFLDVGYGDCTLIRLPDGKTMLIDGGNGRYSNQQKILTALNRAGVKQLDFLVCTSIRSEHCGGLTELLQYKSAKTIYIPYVENSYITDEYYAFQKKVKNSNCEQVIIERGVGYQGQDYFFTFLSPQPLKNPLSEYHDMAENPTSSTAICGASAIMWLSYGNTQFLFLSDASSLSQQLLYQEQEVGNLTYVFAGQEVYLSQCDIVKVANHGSRYSKNANLYDELQAQHGILSVGENYQDDPSIEVLSDLAVNGTVAHATNKVGAITVTVTKTEYKLTEERI